jgi:hypothetical protein
MSDAKKMAKMAENYIPPFSLRDKISKTIEDYSEKKRLAKQKKYCFKVIKKATRKGKREAYVFSANEKLRNPGKSSGPMFSRRYKVGSVRKDYLWMNPFDLAQFIGELKEKGYEVEAHEVYKLENNTLRIQVKMFLEYLLHQETTVQILVIKF